MGHRLAIETMHSPVDHGGQTPLLQRALLPSELYAITATRSRRDRVVDAAVVVVAAAAGALLLAHLWDDRSGIVNAADLAIGSVACGALWARRSHPTGVALFAVGASAFFAMAAGAALAAIFNAAIRSRDRGLLAVAALAVAASTIFPLVNPGAGPFVNQRFPGFMLTAIAIGWGLFVRVRRELIISLRERAERVEAEQQRHLDDAREAERRRIAREMHDVVAHRLSLLSLQAGALELRPDASADEVAQAASIRKSAAAALDELREVISVLREDSDQSTRPQPTPEQLPPLIEESRAAGMIIRAHLGEVRTGSVSDAVGRTTYRVVQEGLTNARKHAPGAAVEVTVTGADAGLVVEVVTARASGGSSANAPSDSGSGLIGLAERVALVGGRLEYGPNAKSDFELRAILPWSQ